MSDNAKVSIIAFNVVVMLGMIAFSFGRGGMSNLHFLDFVLVIVLGLVGAGAAFGVCQALNK